MNIESKLKLFADTLNKGLEAIETACQIYTEAIDNDPSAKELFTAKFADTIPHTMWAGFEAVGRGSLHRGLLFGGGKNARYIKRLPFSCQKDIMEGGKVEMITKDGDTLMVDPLTISKAQADQVFDGAEIRKPAEQKAYVESTERAWDVAEKTLSSSAKFKVKGGKVVIPHGCILTSDEVKQIMMELM